MHITLAHFELLDELGRGGVGVVFRAYDPSLKRHVAIKLLNDDLAQDPSFVADFMREAQNAAAISHPHIVQVFFVGAHEGNHYLVMELVKGRTLAQLLEEMGVLAEADALKVMIEISEALKAGYGNEMIHGDVKPQNIIVAAEGGAKLLDFGLAKLANVEAESTDGVWGSPYYISPERVGRKAEDFRSDIYSLGATIFESLTGRPPFEDKDVTQLALKRLNEKPPLLRTLNPNVSKRTEAIINKMLAKNPLHRYLDYDSLLADLQKAASALGANTDTAEMKRVTGYITATIPPAPPASYLPYIIGLSLAASLAVGVVLYVVLSHNKGAAPSAPTAAALSAAPTPLPNKFGSKIVKFSYKNDTAKEVSLIGNLNQWKPDAMRKEYGAWVVEKEVPMGVTVEYQFVVDGKKLPDPTRPNLNYPDGEGSLKTAWTQPVVRNNPTPGGETSAPKNTPSPRSSLLPDPSVKATISEAVKRNPYPGCELVKGSLPYQDALKEWWEEVNTKPFVARGTLVKAVTTTPEEEYHKYALIQFTTAIVEFKWFLLRGENKLLEYPKPILKRDGTPLGGRAVRVNNTTGTFRVQTAKGEVEVSFADLAPDTLLDMHDYLMKQGVQSAPVQYWNMGAFAYLNGKRAAAEDYFSQAIKGDAKYRELLPFVVECKKP